MAQSLSFDALSREYKKFPPLYFRETGPQYRHTCAVRLADAITRVQPDFFLSAKIATWPEKRPTGRYVPSAHQTVGLKFEPAPQKRVLPIRAGEIKDHLNTKLGQGKVIKSARDIQGQTGIIYFEQIPDYPGSGHISLWDVSAVVDKGEHWDSKQIWFWRL